MTSLLDIEKRLVAAEGRDKTLERDIMCSIGGWQRLTASQHSFGSKHPRFVDTQEGYLSHEGQTQWRDVPAIMASVDAALAFADRVLPGWTIARMSQGDNKLWTVEMREGYATSYNRVVIQPDHWRGIALPRAICLAVIRALIAQKGNSDGDD